MKEAALSPVRARLTSWDSLGVRKGHWPSQASAGARTKVRRGGPGCGNLAIQSQVIQGPCRDVQGGLTPPCCTGWTVLVTGNGWPVWGKAVDMPAEGRGHSEHRAPSQLPDGAMFSQLHLAWRWLSTYPRMVYIENRTVIWGRKRPLLGGLVQTGRGGACAQGVVR